MRLSPVCILVLFMALAATVGWEPEALAREDTQAIRRAQIEAARADALASLRRDVLQTPLASNVTVGQFADRANGRDALLLSIRDAEQIGGTRWLDERTCEVRLDLAGGKVARTLAQIATDNPKAIRLGQSDFDRSLKEIQRLQFSASGVSTTDLENIRPPAGHPGWADVPEAEVRRCVRAAHADAADRLLESVRGVRLDGRQVGDALEVPEVRDGLRRWLLSRPVTAAEFRDNREVRLAVYAPADDFFEVLRESIARHPQARVSFPPDGRAQDELRVQISRRMEPAIGRAVASGGAAAAEAPGAAQEQPVRLPRNLPGWIGEQLDAKGEAEGRWADRLGTAHKARTNALEGLRKQVDQLPLTDRLTLGDAARRDPRIARAVERAMRHARSYDLNYGGDGAVDLVISLNLQDLWYELEESQYGGR